MSKMQWEYVLSEEERGKERMKMWMSESRIEMGPESDVSREDTSKEQMDVTQKETSSLRKRTLHLTSWNSPHLLYDLLDLLVDHEKPEALEEVGTRSDRLRGQ